MATAMMVVVALVIVVAVVKVSSQELYRHLE